jgi:predicted  nucleic acid-binding Zn-ribbon protein
MKKLIATMTTALITTGAFATPTIYPKDVTLLSSIKNTTTSNIIADDSDNRVIWVMPPNTAYSKVGSLHTITANVGFCKEMANIQSYTRNLTERLMSLQEREIESRGELDAISTKISEARQVYSAHVVANNLQDIDKLDERLTIVEEQIAALNEKLNSCNDQCSEISGQLAELRKERLSLAKDRRTMSKDRLRAVHLMDQKKSSVENFEKDFEEAEEKYNKISQDVTDMHTRLLGMYKDFAKMEGARAAISFESDWDKNMQDLGTDNPEFIFKQIQTENALVNTSLMAGNSLPGESAVLAYEISGKAVEGGIEFSSYPPSFSANLRLSLIGTCPILHPDLFDIKVENGTDQMKYGMIISYEYPTTVEASLEVDYHMKKIYEKIVKSKKKGGFFSSSKSSSVTEKNFFKEDFITKWNEQDASHSYTDEEKADIEKEIRDDMMARLAANAVTLLPNPGALIAGGAGASGMAVLGSSLAKNKACQTNAWCMGAAIGANVLNAMFGRSNTTSSYTNIQDYWQHVTWSRKKVILKPWISSYR